jgi:hypothetical protein
MHNTGLSAFIHFKDISKIRFFIYNDIRDIKKYSKILSFSLIKYNYVLIETANSYSFSLNPHYFGNSYIREKNRITRFFITSTIERNYEYLISAAEELKAENLEFQVIVVGKWNTFTTNNISEKIRENFTFKYNISYSELYNEVNNSDFIIINLDPNNLKDLAFKTSRVTGSAQLVYGFLKPAIINSKFAPIYYFNKDNSFIYENTNFTDIIRNAINMKNEEYQKMKKNLSKSVDYIYKISLKNVNICMNHL